MALTILQRPKGYIINSALSQTVTAADDTGEVQFFDASGHTLVDGDFIYLDTPIEDYNGFFQVDATSSNHFHIIDPITGNDVAYIANCTGTYYKTSLEHGFSAVHLPIVYRLSNTLYPTNSVDTAQTITSLSNNAGFAQVGLSGSLGTFEDLSFVKISGANDSDLNGTWQVVDKLSTSSVILNMDYSTVNGAGILGASMQLYYGNYNIVVRVYAGINAAHQWAAQKPYELAATLRLTPDENNEVFFSINDILKAYVQTKNNLLLGTLPNNIDAWTNFYISVAESYDTSNGYTITTNETSFAPDQSTFEGTAINAKLAFKNIYSGYMSEYLMTNNAAKFLTLFAIPILFSCGDDTPECYQDISFIIVDKSQAIAAYLRQQYYSNGSLITTVNDAIDEDHGVIRMPLDEPSCNYDRVDITVLGGEQLLDEPEFDATGDWLQTVTAGRDWTISGGLAFVTILPTTSSELLYQSVSGTAAQYRIIANVTTSNGTGNDWQSDVYVIFITGGIAGSSVKQQLIGTVSGSSVGNVLSLSYDNVITVPGSFDTIALYVEGYAGPTSNIRVNISDIFIASTSDSISETKRFDIDCGCSDQDLNLTWMNNLGGFDYWKFTGQKGHTIDITEATETLKNIFPNWPNSYGEFADTIRKQVSRKSMVKQFIVSQGLTTDQADAIAYIKSSPLVQIINSRKDRRTVIVDTDSFLKYTDGDKFITISFNILYTDDIPSQSV